MQSRFLERFPDDVRKQVDLARHGFGGGFTYSTKPNMDDKPVNFVSWLDAARYVNWLHNGRPSGGQTSSTTENGVYDLSGINPGGTAQRGPGASWFLPDKEEWDTAAYDDPVTGQTWLYPTGNNSIPTVATATSGIMGM